MFTYLLTYIWHTRSREKIISLVDKMMIQIIQCPRLGITVLMSFSGICHLKIGIDYDNKVTFSYLI